MYTFMVCTRCLDKCTHVHDDRIQCMPQSRQARPLGYTGRNQQRGSGTTCKAFLSVLPVSTHRLHTHSHTHTHWATHTLRESTPTSTIITTGSMFGDKARHFIACAQQLQHQKLASKDIGRSRCVHTPVHPFMHNNRMPHPVGGGPHPRFHKPTHTMP